MLDKSHQVPPLATHTQEGIAMPEWQLYQPVKRHILWILLATLTFAVIGWVWSALFPPPHPARAELLARVGYEYTPAPADPTRDYPQITVRLDEAIGTELQLISSPPLIRRALEAQPYPTDAGQEPPSAQDVADRLKIKRVEGSTIIALELLDNEGAWAVAFLNRLIAAYTEERVRLYSQTPYTRLLTEQRDTVAKALTADRAASAELSQTITDALLRWSEGLSLLAEDPLRQADFRVLSAEFAAFQFRMAGRPGASGIANLLSQYATPRVIGPGQNGNADMAHLRGQLTRIGEATDRIVALNERETAMNEQLRSLDDALMRQKIRDLGSANVEVMTPPYLADHAAGLSNGSRAFLFMIIGFILSSVVAVAAAAWAAIPRPEA